MTLDDHMPEGPRGMPIYRDDRVRLIVDSLDEGAGSDGWYPSNTLALKLWHCLEALRDIDTTLPVARSQEDASKQRRHLKMFSVQLLSLAKSIDGLCDQLVGDEGARQRLEPGTTRQVARIKDEFLSLVPIDWNGDLAVLRNKLGGHIDKDIWPWEATEILARTSLSHFGRWLHICLHALMDLTKLDIYAWTCRSDNASLIRLMSKEPFLVTFHVDEQDAKKLVALHIAQRSPKETISDVIASVVENSQWMFQAGEQRIGSLKIDERGDWNTFKEAKTVWKGQPKLPAK